jgi:hypothetical protein
MRTATAGSATTPKEAAVYASKSKEEGTAKDSSVASTPRIRSTAKVRISPERWSCPIT